MRESVCPGCGTSVACGAAPGKEHCWCADLPRVMPVPTLGTGCLCPECLRGEVHRRQEQAKPQDPACH